MSIEEATEEAISFRPWFPQSLETPLTLTAADTENSAILSAWTFHSMSKLTHGKTVLVVPLFYASQYFRQYVSIQLLNTVTGAEHREGTYSAILSAVLASRASKAMPNVDLQFRCKGETALGDADSY